MSNRISIEPIHGAHTGMETPCAECGERYGLVDWVEATDHAVGKKYTFVIITCECHKILNKDELRKTLPDVVFQAVFPEECNIEGAGNEIKLTEKFWDCECKENYIHPRAQKVCPICGANEEEQPDSRVNEVIMAGLPL